jgi:hypothetical protein
VNISTIRFEGIGENIVISITPTHNKTGTVIISVSVSDGELTATTAFNLTVTGVNDAPVISKIANQTIDEDTALTQINFTVSDSENSVLMVSGSSCNLTLVSSIILEGTGENRTISLSFRDGQQISAKGHQMSLIRK